MEGSKASIVTISDTNFVIAVYMLICSLRYHGVDSRIYVLGVDLSQDEIGILEQFDGVVVRKADSTNKRNPTNRKGEALLMAKGDDSDFITLLDGDCLVTGNISKYLAPAERGIHVRIRTEAEDICVYRERYQPGEMVGFVPEGILNVWRKDVAGCIKPQIQNTVTGGNLTLSKEYMSFAQRWHDQILKVVPDRYTKTVHNPSDYAYFQYDESVLNSLLAFDPDAPPVYRGNLDADASAYVAHLGPANPKPWKLWRKEKLIYYPYILELIKWAKTEGYRLPHIPWTFKACNKIPIYLVAYMHSWFHSCKQFASKAKDSICSKR